jgi:hypothetical protein
MPKKTPKSRRGSWYSEDNYQLTYAKIAKELETQSDRGAALILVAFLEDLFKEAMRHRLFVVNDQVTEGLFRFPEPLSSFGSKTKLAYALGVISKNAHADLEQIREIRNRFAHFHLIDDNHLEAEQLSFESMEIHDRCMALKYPEIQAECIREQIALEGKAKLRSPEHNSLFLMWADSLDERKRKGDDMFSTARGRFRYTALSITADLWRVCHAPQTEPLPLIAY